MIFNNIANDGHKNKILYNVCEKWGGCLSVHSKCTTYLMHTNVFDEPYVYVKF